MLFAGVDACRGGWIAVVLDADQFADSISAPTFVELLASVPDARVVGVDIPIGLPSEGARAADVAARVFVGPRRSSVFPTPPRAALGHNLCRGSRSSALAVGTVVRARQEDPRGRGVPRGARDRGSS